MTLERFLAFTNYSLYPFKKESLSVNCVVLSDVSISYPHHGQESVQQVNSQDKGVCAVTKEAGQTPQVLHFGISAFGRDPTVILENEDMLLISLVYQSLMVT